MSAAGPPVEAARMTSGQRSALDFSGTTGAEGAAELVAGRVESMIAFAIEELGSGLPDAKWLELVREFFLV